MFKYLAEFFNMGGYAWYIWPCYGALICLIAWHLLQSMQLRRSVFKKLQKAANEPHA